MPSPAPEQTEAPRASGADYSYLSRRAELPYGLTYRDEIVNYFAWQAELFARHLHGRVLDHGAGTGSLSNALLDAGVRSLVVVEPDPELVKVLRERFGARPGVEIVQGTLDDYARSAAKGSLDCIVSSNVIEHIVDDGACLRTMFEMLRPGGAAGLYVPARPELYGSLDATVGHQRRYTRSDLRAKLTAAGFEIERLEYRNLVGVLPWLVTGRVLKKKAIGRGSLRLFDKAVFPVCRAIEGVLPPPYGLNIVAIGVKPA